MSDVGKLPDPTGDLYPAKRNEKYVLDRPITDEKINAHYNNFYEFNSSKDVAEQAQALKIRPWTIKIDG
ncbi:MAG: protein-methionine-sulfoxide reductase catalytic subunit MsrP, partial [Pseudolabrys sp.]